jgi:hypothetical protein
VMAGMRAERSAEDFAGDLGRQAELATRGRALTSEEAAEWNVKVAQTVEDIETLEQLRKFGQQVVDPTAKPDKNKALYQDLFARAVLPMADSAAIITTMSIPGGWAPAMRLSADAAVCGLLPWRRLRAVSQSGHGPRTGGRTRGHHGRGTGGAG